MKGSAASQYSSPMLDNADSNDKAQDVAYVVTKFLSKGYDSLSNEELAATLINPDFNATFKKQTGTDWIAKYQIQTIDKLKNANFDLNFMTSGITHEKFNAFFVAVIKGDLEVIREYFRKYTDDELLRIVDVSKKSPLHHAAREGRTSMADYLMTKGYRINCRERTLKTPLHYACLFGHAVLADLLLKRGADILAKDCSGRTAFHFACCSWSSETIALVLGLKPELINLGDNIGRTGLHYSVWNSCDAQVDIMRTIIERGANINQVDDYGKTALHYAAEGGRTRAIPILIQKGIDMSIRETRTHKTALELACNERVRELMIVYSSAPYSLKSKDKSFLDNAVKGESVIVRKETIFTDEKVVKKGNPSAFAESIPLGKSNALVPEYWRSKLVTIMTQLQDIGVKSGQHIKRPYLFTGSWLEGVTTIEQLYDRVKGLSANEAMLRLFNILHPFEGDLPASNKEEVAISNFYGEYYNFEVPKETRVDLSAIGSNVIEQSKIASMHQALELANKKNEDLQSKMTALQKDLTESAQQMANFKSKASELDSVRSQYQKLQDSLRVKESDLFMSQKLANELESRIKDEVGGKNNAIEALQKNLNERDVELAKVKKELNAAKAQMKILEASQKQDGPSMYGGSNSAKVMNKFERKRYISQELSKEDHTAIQGLMNRLRINPPDLGSRLRAEDKNADGLVNSYEFLQSLDKLKLLPEESSTLRTIAGFQKYDEIFIEDFVELVNRKVNMDVFTEKSILTNFVTAFHAKRMTVDQAMSAYDRNKDLQLDIGELKQLVIDLGLNLDDKSLQELFGILDVDGSGSIALEELKSKLKAIEIDKISQNPDKHKELNDKMKEKTGLKDIVAKKKDAMTKLKVLDALDDVQEKEKDKFETVDDAERLRNILAKEMFGSGKDNIKKHDFEPLVGEIKIQFQKVSNVNINLKDYKMLYVLLRVPGDTKNWLEKEIHTYAVEQFKYAMRITVMNVLSENIGKSVILKLVGEDKNDLRVDLGTTEVAWKKGLELPNEWIINDSFAFESNGKPSPCTMKIQLKWITAGSPEFKASVYDDYYLKKGFSAPKQEEGTHRLNSGFLQVNLASALLPDIPKSNGENLTLKVITPDSKSYSINPQQAIDEEYQFNQMYVVPVKFLKDDLLASIYVQLKNGKEILGEAYINWSECIFFPKEQSENKAFLLYKERVRTKHKVYLRMQYLTKAQAQLMKLDDKKDIAKDKSAFLNGIMKVGIIRARKLVGDEKGKDGSLTCDPLVRVRFKNHEKYVKFETAYLDQNINPVWDENYTFNVKLLKDAAFPPLEVEVFDHDTWSSNDLVGSTKVRTNDCFAKPCTWAVNNFFAIENSGKPAGEVYICAYFVPEGKFDPNTNALDVETGKEIVPKPGVGKLHLRVVAGRDLVWLKEGIPQPKASPYVQIFLPNDKTRNSKPVTDNLNPNWNYQLMETVDLQSGKLAPIKLEVWNKTGLLSKDVKMSEVTVDLAKLLESKGKWAINELFSLPGEDKYLRPNGLKDMGKLYIQSKVVENSRVDDESEPTMVIEMPKLAEGEIKGILLINVVHCKDLPKVDSGIGGNLCDAFVQCTTKGAEKVYTKTKWGDLNPIFNQKLLMQYKVASGADVEPLRIEIRDEDKMSTSDLVGSVELDLHPVLAAPGTWSVNKIFNIENIEKEFQVKGETPQVYLQVKFLKDGQMDEGVEPPLLEDLSRTVTDRRRKGTLIIRAVHARGLIKADTGLAGSSSDPYVEFIAPPNDKSYKTKVQKNTIIPIWKEEFKHALELSDVRYVSKLAVKVWDHDNLFAGGSDDFLGEVDIDITPCLNDANAWAINKVFELTGPQKMKEKLKLKNFGFVYLQMLFLKEGEELTKKEPEIIEDLEKLSKAAETPGLLVVNCVHAKGLMRGDKAFFGGPGSSDPFVRINWPNGKESSTPVRKGTTTPVWNQVLQQNLVINKLNIPLLHLEVYDDDMMTKDLLGFCFVDLDQVVASPGKWIINGNTKLEGGPDFVKDFKNFGEVYIQVMWLEGSTAKFDNQLPPVTENLKEVIDRASVKGKLELKLIHCAELIAEDDSGLSDPYVIFVMPDKKEIKSRMMSNTLNPIFNQDISHPLTIQDTFIEPIEMRVMDSDTLNPDDPLGKATLSIEECVHNPGQWKVNKIIKLEPFGSMKVPAEGEPPRQLGEIYVQARFVKDGLTDNTPPPPLLKDLEKELKDKRIEGKLWIVVVHAKGLQVEKPRNAKISCTLKIEGVNDKGETTKTSVSRNPAFGDVIKFNVNLESEKALKPLKISLTDNGFISLTSSTVGEVSIDLNEMLKVPKNQWFLNKIFKLTGPKDLFDKFKGNIGEIYLQAKFQDNKEESMGERPQLLEDISKTVSTERLKGKLIVYLVSVLDVVPYDGKTADPLVHITFHKDTKKTEKKEKTVNAEYKNKFEFPVDFDSAEFAPAVMLEVIDWNLTINELIGKAFADMKKCFETPNKYVFNEVLKLTGPEKLQGKYRSFGSIYLQAKYLTEGTPDADDFAPMLVTMEEHMKKNRVKGSVIVSVVHAKYLLDQGKSIDPYLKITFPSKEVVETKTIKGTSFPVWGERVTNKVDLNRNDAGFIDFEVMDNCWGRDGNIGKFTVDMDACYAQPNTWAVNSVFQVQPPASRSSSVLTPGDLKAGSCGKVYLQVKYLPEGATEDLAPPIMMDTTPQEDRVKEGLYGQLKFVVKSAKDLPNKDGFMTGVSDPYTVIKLPDGQKKQTKVINDNLNPVWNETVTFDVKIDASHFKPIEFEVRDDDVGSSDLCGGVLLGIDKLKAKPGEWAVNEVLSLSDGKVTKGKLYIQGKFLPEGAADTGPAPAELTY